MPKKTYTAQDKENALRLFDEIGAKKASEQTGVFINTLYNWRRAKEEAVAGVTEIETPVDVPAKGKKRAITRSTPTIKSTRGIVEKLGEQEMVQLQVENNVLRAQIKILKNALKAFAE